VLDATTASFLTAQETKVNYLTVTRHKNKMIEVKAGQEFKADESEKTRQAKLQMAQVKEGTFEDAGDLVAMDMADAIIDARACKCVHGG
jgi:hypothetical protein